MESGILGCGIRNPQTWNPESTAWNPESKTLLDNLTWGEKYLRPELTRMAARLGVCNNKLNYSRVQLVSLKKYATAFLPSLVITSLKQEGLLRIRGVRSGLKRRRKLSYSWWSISVITRHEDLNMTTTTDRHQLMAHVTLTI